MSEDKNVDYEGDNADVENKDTEKSEENGADKRDGEKEDDRNRLVLF